MAAISIESPGLARRPRWSPEIGLRARQTLALFLAVFTFLQLRGSLLLGDPDTYWHIVVGGRIWARGAVPRADEFSYTMSGAHWIAKEWLSQVLLYLAFAADGWTGVCVLTATIAAASCAVLFWWLSRRLEPIVALTMTVVTLSFTTGSTLARPQIFYFLMLTLSVCTLVDSVETRRAPWPLVPLVAIWANLHPSFPIIFVLAPLFAVEALLRSAPRGRAAAARGWGLALLGSWLAAGATPYGFEPLLVSLKIFGAPEVQDLQEWRPVTWDFHGAYAVGFMVAGFLLLAAARSGWARAAPVAVCAFLMMRHVRFMALFGIVTMAALAPPLARRFPQFAAAAGAPGAGHRRAFSAACALLLCAAVGVVASVAAPRPAPAITPSAALEAARRDGLDGPVFNDYNLGSYLIFRGVKTFIDGRAELYFNGLFQKVTDAERSSSTAPLEALLEQYHPTWALLGRNSDNARQFAKLTDWKRIYEDEVAEIYVPR